MNNNNLNKLKILVFLILITNQTSSLVFSGLLRSMSQNYRFYPSEKNNHNIKNLKSVPNEKIILNKGKKNESFSKYFYTNKLEEFLIFKTILPKKNKLKIFDFKHYVPLAYFFKEKFSFFEDFSKFKN